jgi:hypothetical protein
MDNAVALLVKVGVCKCGKLCYSRIWIYSGDLLAHKDDA